MGTVNRRRAITDGPHRPHADAHTTYHSAYLTV